MFCQLRQQLRHTNSWGILSIFFQIGIFCEFSIVTHLWGSQHLFSHAELLILGKVKAKKNELMGKGGKYELDTFNLQQFCSSFKYSLVLLVLVSS